MSKEYLDTPEGNVNFINMLKQLGGPRLLPTRDYGKYNNHAGCI